MRSVSGGRAAIFIKNRRCSRCKAFLGKNPPDFCRRCHAQLAIALSEFDPFKNWGEISQNDSAPVHILSGDLCGRCHKKIKDHLCPNCGTRYNTLGTSE